MDLERIVAVAFIMGPFELDLRSSFSRSGSEIQGYLVEPLVGQTRFLRSLRVNLQGLAVGQKNLVPAHAVYHDVKHTLVIGVSTEQEVHVHGTQ